MEVVAILEQAVSRGIDLYVKDGKLLFKAKPNAFTDELKSAIGNNKAQIIEHLLYQEQQIAKAEQLAAEQQTPLVPRASDEPTLLSFGQQRLWFLDQLLGANAIYNMPLSWRLNDTVDPQALMKAVQQLTERHQVLRSRMVKSDQHQSALSQSQSAQAATAEQVVQLFDETGPQLVQQTVSSEAQLQQLCQQQRTEPFDLSKHLCRFRLTRDEQGRYALLATFHHSVFDGWSIRVFCHELTQLYAAIVNGQSAPLPPLVIQYGDFAHWQRRYLQGDVLKRQLSYWREQLADLTPLLNLPTDRERPLEQSFIGRTEPISLSANLTGQLQHLSRQYGVTLFMTLISTFAMLLGRYAGQQDIAIGTPIANRTRNELENLIGFFVNTLVMRVDLSGDPNFASLVKRVREMALQAYEHQDVPFEQLVDEINPERNMSHTPLFQVMFSLHNTPVDSSNKTAVQSDLQGHQLQLSPLTFDSDTGTDKAQQQDAIARFDLSLDLQERADGIVGSMEYNIDLFDASTVRQMLVHFERLLEAIVSAPLQSISRYPLLTPTEQHQQLFNYNATAMDYDHHTCLHQLFEQQVLRQPDAIALIHEYQHVSFAELNRRANQLANYLIEQGVGPEVSVGVFMHRSVDLLVALLAVLKAGGCYIPLDPNYPKPRLSYLIGDSQVALIITQKSVKQAVDLDKIIADSLINRVQLNNANHHPQPVRSIDIDERDILATYDHQNPNRPVNPSNLAYVIYTSGSTGKPKGVAIAHQGVISLLHWAANTLDKADRRSVLAGTSMCFDLSVYEFFLPLCFGTECILIDNIIELDSLPQRNRITLINTVPSAAKALLDKGALPDQLKVMNLAGEPLKAELVNDLYQLGQVEQVYDLYGPSEDTTYSTGTKRAVDGVVSIGKPIANTQAYILGPNGELTVAGAIGELYLAGVSLARGYVGRSAMSAEQFVPNPYSKEPGQRMYRTGDLVRYLPDGDIQYIGRVDHQIKIRGFRIELGEVETRLVSHPQVKDVVVIVRQDQPQVQRLVAYVVTQGQTTGLDSSDFIETLRDYVAEKLPQHMVPAHVMLLPALPLTVNGKVDRKALPVPDVTDQQSSYQAPVGQTQQLLCQVWQQVLGIDKVGVNDNFFSIGGDSIQSIAVVSKAKVHDIHLTVRLLFKYPTISQLAAHLPKTSQQIEQADSQGELPLLPIQQWFLQHNGNCGNHFHQSQIFTVQDDFNLEFLHHLVCALYQRHDVLRLCFNQQSQPQSWQADFRPLSEQMLADSVVHYPLTGSASTCIAQVNDLAFAIKTQFDIGCGPLFKAVYFETPATQSSYLLLVLHHLIVDGVSWRILLQDMGLAYEQWRQSRQISLATKTTSYQHWSEALAKYSKGEQLRQQRGFWLAQLTATFPSMPCDNLYQGPDLHCDAEQVFIGISKEQTQALLERCALAYKTQIQELLLTALVLAFHRWGGLTGIQVLLEGHGREDALMDGGELAETLGWFTSLYPLALRIGSPIDSHTDGQGSLMASTIMAVKEQLRAVPKRGIGYGLLRYLAGDDDLAKLEDNHQQRVLFNYLGQFDQQVSTDAAFIPAKFEDKHIDTGSDIDAQHQRRYWLGFNGAVNEGCLQFAIDYNVKRFNKSSIEKLGQDFVAVLTDLIEHCQLPDAGQFTPSDFPLAQVNQADLSQWQCSYPQLSDIYPTTGLQMGLIFHSLLDKHHEAYVTQLYLDFKGAFNQDTFMLAWQQLLLRHDIFRTGFIATERRQPLQAVMSSVSLPWQQLDWRDKDTATQNAAFDAYRRHDKQLGFDFAQPPLMRMSIIRLSDDCYRWFWTHHHSLLDGWSVPLVLNELFAIYHAIEQQQSFQLPAVACYRDFISWLCNQSLQKAHDYWANQLAGFDTPTQIAATVEQQSVAKTTHAKQTLTIEASIVTSLNRLAQRYQVTLNAIIQGAWSYILHRYSGDVDIVFGQTVSGRSVDVTGIEQMVGLFINTLPVRVGIDNQQSLSTWLQNLHQTQVERESFGYLALADIQGHSEIEFGQGLFHCLLVFENYPTGKKLSESQQGAPNPLGFDIADVGSYEGTDYDLTLMILPGEQLVMKLEYNQHKYHQQSILDLLQNLQCTLQLMLNDNVQTVAQLDGLMALQVPPLIKLATGPLQDKLDNNDVMARLTQRAQLHPNAIVLADNQHHISYQQLMVQVNDLACQLACEKAKLKGKLTANRQDNLRIGLQADLSIESIVAMLAIWQVGGCCVPLYPQTPLLRQHFVIEDAGLTILLADTHQLNRLSASAKHFDALVMMDWSVKTNSISHHQSLPQLLPANDEVVGNEALLLYGYDVSGQPEQQGLTHQLLGELVSHYEHKLSPEQRLLHQYPLRNDFSLLPLLAGILGQTVEETVEETAAQRVVDINLLQQQQKSVMHPSFHSPVLSDVGVMGHVGINSRALILDELGVMVPQGVAGRLYLAFEQNMTGHSAAQIEAQIKKVSQQNGRVDDNILSQYEKTDYLVRMQADGQLSLVGRMNNRYKGVQPVANVLDMAALLCEHQHVEQAVVTIDDRSEKSEKSQQFTAYVVLAKSQILDANLESQLKRLLTQQAQLCPVPALFISVEDIPVSDNGAVDVWTLAAINQQGDNNYIAPRGEIETLLSSIWVQVLDVPRVSRDDNFFELGGHSLLATRLMAWIRQSFNVEITIAALFEQVTLQAQAQVIEQLRRNSVDSHSNKPLSDEQLSKGPLKESATFGNNAAIMPLTQASPDIALPLSFAQQRLWFLNHYMGPSAVYNIPLALQLQGQLDVRALTDSIDAIFNRHDALRTRFGAVAGSQKADSQQNAQTHQSTKQPEAVQIIDQTLPSVALETVTNQAQLAQICDDERYYLFNLTDEPLCRVRLLHVLQDSSEQGEDHYVLLVTMHHSISDGWSLGVFFSELVSLYQAKLAQVTPSLPELEIQYHDFAFWQRQYLQGEVLSQELAYWRKQLAGLPPLLNLPTDRPRPLEQTFNGDSLPVALTPKLSKALEQFSHSQGVTLFMTLLSGFALLMSRYAGQKDVAIGTPIANRNRKETENLIGFFVNTIVMRCDFTKDPSFIDLVRQTRQMTLDGYDHQDLPFELLVEALNPQRSLSHSPLFQVMFTLLNLPLNNASLSGLEISPLQREENSATQGVARFDLTFSLQQTPEGIVGEIEYNTDLFDSSTIESMMEHYQILLTGALATPTLSVSRLDYLSESQYQYQQHLLSSPDKIETNHQLHWPLSIEQWFNAQARVLDDQTIDLGVGDRVSLHALNHSVDTIAKQLLAMGVKTGQAIGLFIGQQLHHDLTDEATQTEASLAQLSGLLAIIKVGGCVVALDSQCSSFRLAYLIELGELNLIVASKSLIEPEKIQSLSRLLVGGNRAKITWIDGAAKKVNPANVDLGNELDSRTEIDSTANPFAGVVYTCDSQERLKGQLKGQLFSHQQLLALSLAYDDNLSSESKGTMPHKSAILDRFARGLTQALILGFEPTAATSLYSSKLILDSEGHMVARGVLGELVVTGPASPSGYFKQATATGLDFVPNAYSQVSGERWYRSGILARLLNNGDIEYYSIEDAQDNYTNKEYLEDCKCLSLNSALLDLSAVNDAVTLIVDGNILSYVVLSQERQESLAGVDGADGEYDAQATGQLTKRLREMLRQQPQVSALPHQIVFMSQLPVNALGSIDIKALPVANKSPQRNIVAATTLTEQKLVAIWQKALNFDDIGIDDNYFVLGGDSIRSIALVAEANKQGLAFSVKDLFAYPTIAQLAYELDKSGLDNNGQEKGGLKADGQNLLLPFELLSEQVSQQLAGQIDMSSIDDAYPLSLMQLGMVMESQRQRSLNVYANLQVYQIDNPWDRDLFEQALTHLVEKHPMMRSVTHLNTQQPLQLVLKSTQVDITVVDARQLDDKQLQSEVTDWMAAQKQQGVDIARQYWRCQVFIVSDTQFFFGMYLHHILWDGWSLESFITELYGCYHRLITHGDVAQYQPLPSFAEFIRLEQMALASKEQQQYWRDKLIGANLPWWTGKEQAESKDIRCQINVEDSRALSHIARQLGVQEKSLWCSIYLTLVALLNGSDDVVGSVLTQGRPEIPGGDKIIGLFLNALPLRVNMTNLSWAQFIQTTDEQLRKQHGYRYFPLIEIQSLTGMEFSAAMFNYTNWHVHYEQSEQSDSNVDVGILTPKKVSGWAQTNYAINVDAYKDDKTEQFGINIGANSVIFDAEFRQRIKGYVTNIINQLIKATDCKIDKTALLDDSERQLLLKKVNQTQEQLPLQIDQSGNKQSLLVHQLFEQQVNLRPDAIALIYQQQQLSYGQLNRRANRLAYELMSRGVGLQSCVGLCVERSDNMMIGLLAILKAGACYVSLDPTYPKQRLEYMISNSKIGWVVTTESLRQSLDFSEIDYAVIESAVIESAVIESAVIENSTADTQQISSGANEKNPNVEVFADSLAYVIYTSGSTGQPKGVQISHHNVVNFLATMAQQPGISSEDRLLAVTTLSFDIAVLELLLPLSQGACVDIADSRCVQDGQLLAKRIESQQISIMQATPVSWKMLLQAGWSGNSQLTALVGGEAFPSELAGALLTKTKAVWNLYGPTETTIWSVIHQVTDQSAVIPIGKPIANTQVYVLDKQLGICPVGVPGELYIGGDGLSAGYLNQPGMTAKQFIAHPYSDKPGERLYATGDMARMLPSGALECLGRIDHQVKLRGLRIELGEIETILQRHQQVKDAVVMVREDEPGHQRLVAYVVTEDGVTEDGVTEDEQQNSQTQEQLIAQLRSDASAQLPAYMVPNAVMLLAQLPLTANGKVDRKALPALDSAYTAKAYVEPQNELEIQLADIWCELLQLERVGRFDNFFELGGHSLLVLQLTSRLRNEMAVELELNQVFELGDLASMAAFIETDLKLDELDESMIENMTEEEAEAFLAALEQQQ